MDRKEVLDWCRQQYGTEPDYPWKDRNAVLRHTDSQKWYGVILEVNRSKLGLDGIGTVEILNVKCDPLLIGTLRMRPGFYPAYHMNKYHWNSIILDGTVPDDDIKNMIDDSFDLTKPKAMKKTNKLTRIRRQR